MDFYELAKKTRSVRKFDENVRLTDEEIMHLMDIVSVLPVSRNRASYSFYHATGDEAKRIYPHMRWAMNIPEWEGPAEGERPGSLLLVLTEDVSPSPMNCVNLGIAALGIVMGAREMGYSACILRSIDHNHIARKLGLKKTVQLVIALGKGTQEVTIEPYEGSDKYWMDEDGGQHVPKRTGASYLENLK